VPWDGQTITLCIKDNKVETIFAGKLEPPPPGPPEPGMVPVKISGWIKEGDVKPVAAAPAAQPGGK
jgi:hypothetical protein